MRHKWSIPKVNKGQSAYCLRCNLIKEMSDNSLIFYFKLESESTTDTAGKCPGKIPAGREPQEVIRKEYTGESHKQ